MEGLGKDLDFGLDNFQQQKMLSEKDSLAQVILNLFVLRPGNLPSQPHIGINIREYLYKFEDNLDADALKDKIYNQCSALISYINLGEVKVFTANYKNQDVLLISIPIFDDNNTESTILYGFTKDQSGNVLFNYEYTDDIIKNI